MFRFNGKESLDFNIIVLESNHLSRAKRKFETIPVPGRTGDLLIEDNSVENNNIEIKVVIDGTRNNDIVGRMEAIEDWLYVQGYSTLEFDDGSIFNAYLIGDLETTTIIKNLIEAKLTFTAFKKGGSI